MDETFKLTNTEKLALSLILSQEQAAEQKIAQLKTAFEADLRQRIEARADDLLSVDVSTGTVSVKRRDAVSN